MRMRFKKTDEEKGGDLSRERSEGRKKKIKVEKWANSPRFSFFFFFFGSFLDTEIFHFQQS